MKKQKNNILVINAGSTSIKFSVIDFHNSTTIISGNFQGVGTSICSSVIKVADTKHKADHPNLGFSEAVHTIAGQIKKLTDINNIAKEIIAVGHRVVQGGDFFTKSVIIDDKVYSKIESISYLAPLHNHVQLKVIKLAQSIFASCPHIAIFDTAFHTTIPVENHIYPIPYHYYRDHKIRRYGFHGISYRYIVKRMEEHLTRKNLNLIVCHMGGGVSCCAIQNSKSLATSMGYGPLGGCVMATRSGDLDPTVISGMMLAKKISYKDALQELNKSSGMQGISGVTGGDMRLIEDKYIANDPLAILSFNIFSRKILDYISQYYVLLDGNVDGIILTAGIGENSTHLQNRLLDKLKKPLHLKALTHYVSEADDVKRLTTTESPINMYVVATNEELMMATDSFELVKK